jgi:hypothetical protein
MRAFHARGELLMDPESSRSTPDWYRTSFWRDVEAEVRRVEPLELARFAGRDGLRAPERKGFERELWKRLKAQFPI